jgi:hypothetical protein
MALGPYNHPGTIGEGGLDALLSQYNSLLSSPFGVSVTDSINSALFPSGGRIPYQADTSTSGTVNLTAGTSVFLEYGKTTGSDTIGLATNNTSALIVIGAGHNVTFTDLGNAADVGDTIVAGNAENGSKQDLSVTQGANLLIGGTGVATLNAGIMSTSNDSLYGGGKTVMNAGSAGTVHMLGGIYKTSADTLVGGSGNDLMKTKFGSNTIIAGTGHDTITSLDRGNDGAGGDVISLTAGGSALVNIGTVFNVGAATDTVVFGGTSGDDTIVAHGAVQIDVVGETLTNIDQTGGTTKLTFADNQTLTYSGAGHVTLHFG